MLGHWQRRKFSSTSRALSHTARYDLFALFTGLGRCLTCTFFLLIGFDAIVQRVDRPMAGDVAGHVEHETVGFTWTYSKSAPYLLIVHTGRECRTQQDQHVDVRRIESDAQHIDVDQTLYLFLLVNIV